MVLARALRPAARAARFLDHATRRPTLPSPLLRGRILPSTLAGVHTTSPKTQEAAALQQEPETDLATTLPSAAPKTDLKPDTQPEDFNVHIITPSRRALHVSDQVAGQHKENIVDAAWIRDRCSCTHCVSPSSGNKSFSTAEIPKNIAFESVKGLPDGSFEIRWTHDIPRAADVGHVSVFPASGPQSLKGMLAEKTNLFYQHGPPKKLTKFWWSKTNLAKRLQKIDYKDYMEGGPAFGSAALSLAKIGLVFLTNVPQTETAVADIALKFGSIKETFYGRTWDVISKPDAENVAYTSSYLGLHSDMLYLESPPRIQLLHCLENSCSGGESIFSDALRATTWLEKFTPQAYRALTKTLVPYHYNKNGFFYRQARPVIVHSDLVVNREVWWSPPFQAPFPVPSTKSRLKSWQVWIQAARLFQETLEHENNVYQHKLQPGECVLFDNRRVLHGRRAFDTASGRRWLKGTYVADEDFKSALRPFQ
ncbi:TfdA family Taurine catabolism dioxygenase TauD [Colletotrichum orchidophilum]|uniref:TfdA family Taurine catabolism dioxygenase TauD n=1 Tax=Colletotrichum orchidophilum TaxID=1209926 RepID=A0A1G4BJZ1_9PEZI|nr:TfdA family Taurine catabolism dioxygenase TauD [Colletotrichum orchidophilum]OHF01762.1 TfdA family Taurine catabolism dioxygenase TauD [Colletotrichum orchidophilum]